MGMSKYRSNVTTKPGCSVVGLTGPLPSTSTNGQLWPPGPITRNSLRVRLYMVRDVLQVEFDPEPVVIDGLHAGHHRGVHREALGHLERPLTGHVVAHPAHVLDSDLSAASQPAGLAGDDRLTLAEQ